MSKNNRKIEEIDEAAMLQSIYERDNGISNIQLGEQETKQPETQEKSKEKIRTKRAGQQEYESLFICESDLPPARFGKSVYIRKEYHDRISQIISVIGSIEVSLFGYIDNVLTHHFENFGDDITQSFKKNIIFK
jgi:hypothetical protein